jgi:peptide/nickel transport system ATP-binding protein
MRPFSHDRKASDPRDRGGPLQPLLIARDLRKHFSVKGSGGKSVKAVDGVSFTLRKGETLGIVGESGCGKSTLARLLSHLLIPDAGELVFDGDLVATRKLPVDELRRQVQIVFQDSYSSLNPRMPVRDSVAFGPFVHGKKRQRARDIACEMLAKVGLDPDLFGPRYPHELSGGQKQRVNIARALATGPRMVILDEPVSALDKSVETQVLNLLRALKQQFNLTYLFISHDLNVVRYLSDRVLVMYLGRVVEIGPIDQVFERPLHPYTRALLASRPSMDPARRIEEAPISGDPPNPIDPPPGCHFHTRCPFAETPCQKIDPALGAGVDRRTMSLPAICTMWHPVTAGWRMLEPSINGTAPLVEVSDLSVQFVTREATVHAVNGVSFQVRPGEVLCLLGESGSGKTVTLRALMRLLPSRRTQIAGRVRVDGHDVMAMRARALRDLRGGSVSMVFQEPMTALDPVYTVGQQIGETLRRHTGCDRRAARARALELLELMRIPSAERRLDAYPHELSGGLRQRAMIAMALSCNPRLLLADEPKTALDATVQIQVLVLLRRLQSEFGMGMIFVTHDLGVAAEIADTVAVMYAGRIVRKRPSRSRVAGAGASLYGGTARFDRARPAAQPRHRCDPGLAHRICGDCRRAAASRHAARGGAPIAAARCPRRAFPSRAI